MSKKNLSNNTVISYQKLFDRFGSHPLVNQPENYYNELKTTKDYSLSHLKNIFIAIRYHLNKQEKKDESVIKSYDKKITDIIKEMNSIKSDVNHGQLTEKSEKWSDLINRRKKYIESKETKNKYHRNKIISLLYVIHPPRRLEDYHELYVESSTTPDLSVNKNYYLRDKGEFIINHYKTSRVYGQYRFTVDKKSKDDINEYLDIYEITKGERMFDMKYTAFANAIESVFGTSVNGLRHAFITEKYKNGLNLSNDELNKISRAMGHNLKTHLSYRSADSVKKDDTTIIMPQEENKPSKNDQTVSKIKVKAKPLTKRSAVITNKK